MRSGRLREFGTDACRVVHGDALEVLDDAVPDGTVDLVFADPPYNLGKRFGTASDSWPDEASYLAWTRCWLDLCVRKLAPTGSMYVMASTQAMPHVDLHLRGLVTILSRIVWHYDSSGIQARQRFGSLYEPILHAVADRARYTFNADAVLVEARTGARRRLVDRRGAGAAAVRGDEGAGQRVAVPARAVPDEGVRGAPVAEAGGPAGAGRPGQQQRR